MPDARHCWLTVVLLAVAACSRSAPPPAIPAVVASYDGPALVGTVATADGITTIDFPADAFHRARQFVVDSVPAAVIGGSGAPPEFDLTYAGTATILPSGGYASLVSMGGGHLMLFDSTGKPTHNYGKLGQGPGEFTRPNGPILLDGDTLLIPDGANRRFNYFLPDKGLLTTVAMAAPPASLRFGLEAPVGRLRGNRIVWSNNYFNESDTLHISRPPDPIGVSTMTGDSLRVIDSVAGFEMTPVATHYRGRARTSVTALRFGRRPSFAIWDTLIAVANGADGYVIDLKDPAGHLVRRIKIAMVRRVVTKSMRDAQIAVELGRFGATGGEGMVDPAETKRLIYDTPFADSLPPYQGIFAAPGGILWVLDAIAPSDTSWDATAFRRDGAIIGRLHLNHTGMPVAFGRDRVVVRTVDSDGVVSFEVYRFR
jgi:hypothetical protein